MAYRRKHGTGKASTFEDFSSTFAISGDGSSPGSLAAQAIRASAAHRDSSLSSAYGDSVFYSSVRDPVYENSVSFSKTPAHHECTSMRSFDETNTSKSKDGFWGVLARKVKSILEDDDLSQQLDDHSRNGLQMLDTSTRCQPNSSHENNKKAENLASSLNYIGGTIKNALEEGLTIVENKTADIIHETKKLQIRRKSTGFNSRNQVVDSSMAKNISQDDSDQHDQLKASRQNVDAMAAKAKLLLRELKTLKADLAFTKERCSQLEEENKLLRDGRKKDENSDDDLIRLQLETLLAEKGRLAHENSAYARENRFLREIVEYHQLTMQDIMHLGDAIEDVSEGVENIRSFSLHSSHSASEMLSPNLSSPHSPTLNLGSPLLPAIDAELGVHSLIISALEEGEEVNDASFDSSPKFDGSMKGLLTSP